MDNDIEIRISALRKCRDLATQYVAGKIDWLIFWEELPKNFAPFDPLDCSLGGLTENQQQEILFYFEWYRGDEYIEYVDRIPRKPDWKYGESDEAYGWVDKEKYRDNFTCAFEKIKESNQILDPTWTTPVLKATFNSQAGQD